MRRGGAATLGVAIAALLAACGGEQSTSTGQPTALPLPSVSTTPTATELPAAGPEATPIPDGSRIIIDKPDASTTIQSPVEVQGTASVDGGTVVVVVLDGSGNELGRSSTTATAVAPAFGHFDATVNFTGQTPGAKGQIKAFGVNPRNGNPTWFYWISVRFG